MAPIVDGLGEEFQGRATALQLDAAQATNASLQADFGLRGHPTFAVLNGDGLVTQRFFGPQLEDVLHNAMESVTSQ